MKEYRRLRLTPALVTGLLAIFLTACATDSKTIVKSETVIPPNALLEPCEKPEVTKLETNEDLIHFTSIAVMQWEACAAKIDALRVFFGLDSKE
jgi:hypothetical protein